MPSTHQHRLKRKKAKRRRRLEGRRTYHQSRLCGLCRRLPGTWDAQTRDGRAGAVLRTFSACNQCAALPDEQLEHLLRRRRLFPPCDREE